jgi:hypothetical protein
MKNVYRVALEYELVRDIMLSSLTLSLGGERRCETTAHPVRFVRSLNNFRVNLQMWH